MVEVTQEDDREIAAELAHALGMTAEEFTSGACDVLVQIAARHRQAGVQQGLDMAAAYIQAEYPFDKRKLVPAIRKLGGGDAPS